MQPSVYGHPARVRLPKGISKEFKLGLNIQNGQVEIQLTEQISVLVAKEDIKAALTKDKD